jgi:hypothetical protein
MPRPLLSSGIFAFFPVAVVLAAATCAGAADAHFDLPDMAIPGADMEIRLQVDGANGQVKDIKVHESPGVHIRQGSGHSLTSVNGALSETYTLNLQVDAQPEGATTVTVPAAEVTISDGSTLTAPAVVLPIGHGDARLVGDQFAEATVDPAVIVPGQPTTLTVKIWLRSASAIEPAEVKPPDDAIILANHGTWTLGSSYDASGQRWVKCSASWQIAFSTPGGRDFGGQQDYQVSFDVFRNERRTVPVKPAHLEVSPLPMDGRPADFTGLIGPVALTANLDRARIAAGEGSALSVTISGRQVDLATAPQPQFPAGLQAYPAPAPVITKDADGIPTKTWHWDLVPTAPGDLVIPALDIGYFDPGSRSYRQATTAPLTLSVLPGRNRSLVVAGAAAMTPVSASAAAPAQAAITAFAPVQGASGGPPPLAPWGALAGGILVGLAAGFLARGARRGPTVHRGKTLLAALHANDLDGAARAIHALMPDLSPDQAASAATITAAIDRARFGGGTFDDALREQAKSLGAVR